MISCECNSSHIDTIESQLHRSRFRTFESSLSMVGYLAGGLGPFRNQDWTQRTCQGSGVWGRVMHRLGVRFCFWMMILVLLSCSIFLVVVYEQSSCIINHQYIINNHQTFISQFSLEFSVHVVSMLSGLARFWQRELLSWMVPRPRLAVVFSGWARMGNLKPWN